MEAKDYKQQFGDDIQAAEKHFDSLVPSYPQTTGGKGREDRQNWRAAEHDLAVVFEEYLKDVSGLTKLSEEQQKKIWDMAWERGHSSGYVQIYSEITDLVGLFD